MTSDSPKAEAAQQTGPVTGHPAAAPQEPRALSPEAQRALAEAEERRRLAAERQAAAPRELGGRNGPDPARYGDWEKDGIVSDF